MTEPTPEQPEAGKALVVLIVVLLAGWWLYSDDFERHYVLNDLRDYATTIRRSEISTGCKEELLELVHSVADQVRDDKIPGGWDDADEAIREMLRSEIECEETMLIRLELRRALRRVEDE